MKITRVGIIIVLMTSSLIALAFYFGLKKVASHRVESVQFSNNLSQSEKNELRELIAPMIEKGYYHLNTEQISGTIDQVDWVAKVQVNQASAFSLNIKVIKDEVLFLFNQSFYLNQFLEPRNLTESIIHQIESKKIAHIYCKNEQIEQAIVFYNQLLEKFEIHQGIKKNIIETLQITKLEITAINQLKVSVDFSNPFDNFEATFHFGITEIEKKMDNLIENLGQIIDEVIRIKLNRSVDILVDLRYPKGFSLKEIN